MADKRTIDIPVVLLLVAATALAAVAALDRVASLRPDPPDIPAAIALSVVSGFEWAAAAVLCLLLPWRPLRAGWPVPAAAASMAVLGLLRPVAIAWYAHRPNGGLFPHFLLTDYHATGSLPIPLPIALAWLSASTAGFVLLALSSAGPARRRLLPWMACAFGVAFLAALLFPTFPVEVFSSLPPPPYAVRWLRGWSGLRADGRIPLASDIAGKVLMSLALALWGISRHRTPKPV